MEWRQILSDLEEGLLQSCRNHHLIVFEEKRASPDSYQFSQTFLRIGIILKAGETKS